MDSLAEISSVHAIFFAPLLLQGSSNILKKFESEENKSSERYVNEIQESRLTINHIAF